MKKLTKILSVIAIVAILVVSLSVFVSCNKPEPVTEDGSFALVVRKANGFDGAAVKIDGTVLADVEITVKAGQATVADAFAAIDEDPDENTIKIKLSETDYLVFTNSAYGYGVANGHFDAEPNYIADDFSWSYIAIDGVASPVGISSIELGGLHLLTIVIDGWNGTIGA